MKKKEIPVFRDGKYLLFGGKEHSANKDLCDIPEEYKVTDWVLIESDVFDLYGVILAMTPSFQHVWELVNSLSSSIYLADTETDDFDDSSVAHLKKKNPYYKLVVR